MRGELYAAEDELQALLEEYPVLLLGESDDDNGDARYLLVQREVGVPESDGASDRWFLDHLFLDREGVPTLVEVKRSTDSRIRREVVGQMLDYAANILAHWPPERMRQEFESRCERTRRNPAEEVATICDSDYEEYWTRVKTNLAAKRLRLVFVADHIPPSLQTIVEFLNEQLRSTEVIAVEVKQHRGMNGLTVLPTQTIGRTATAQHAKATGEKREWNEELALDELRRTVPAEAVVVAQRLLDWARDQGLEVGWGEGAKIGTGSFLIAGSGGTTAKPFGISTDGKLDLYPKQMKALPPFDQDEPRRQFIDLMCNAAGMPTDNAFADQSFKAIPLAKLTTDDSYNEAVGALEWFLSQTTARDVHGDKLREPRV